MLSHSNCQPARASTHIQQAPTVCRTGAAPGRLLRAVLAARTQLAQACPALQAGRGVGAGIFWWFGGTPLVEDHGRGGPRIVEAQGGEGMVSRSVGEGQPPGRLGQPEPPALASKPVFADSPSWELPRDAPPARLLALCWEGRGAGLCDPHSTLGTRPAGHPSHPSLLRARMETWPLVAAPGASHWTHKDGRPVQAPLVRTPLPGAAGGTVGEAPSASQGGTTCSQGAGAADGDRPGRRSPSLRGSVSGGLALCWEDSGGA